MYKPVRVVFPLLLGLFACVPPPLAAAGTGLLRFPDVCGERIVFTYAGDLWTVARTGGTAQRLTAGPGVEQAAHYSPDCSQVAFTGNYSGDEQVFVIPASGGEPKQLTWYPSPGPLPARWGIDAQVYGWTPDGKAVLFRSMRDAHGISTPQLFTIPLSGGLPERLPMPEAGSGTYSPDGKQIVYSPKYRTYRTWKRYSGGWAEDLHIYDFASRSARNISNDPHTDRDPMWIGQSIYFLSDRNGEHMNLFRHDPASGQTTQLTDYAGQDARWAESDGQRWISFEVDGTLHLFDTETGSDTALTIQVPSDRVQARASMRSVKEYVEDFDLSANGKRALVTARGEIFSVPLEHGLSLDLTRTPGVHEREANWSKDGRWITYVSDASGEEAIWISAADGSGARQLTRTQYGRLYAPRFSPDGTRIAFIDSQNRLYVIAAKGGEAELIADDPSFSNADFAWSVAGHYLAYSLTDAQTLLRQLHVHDFASGRSRRLGRASANAGEPAFSPDGKYLYFLGDREFAPQLSSVEWNFAGNRSTAILAYALRKDVENPFAPRNDSAIEADAKGKDAEGGKPAAIEDHIDFDGLDSRLLRVPVEADNVQGITVTDKDLLYVVSDAPYYGRDGAFKPRLKAFSFADRKERLVHEGLDGIAVAADGKTALIRDGQEFQRIALGGDKAEAEAVKLDGLFALVDPKAEYAEIFREVWRRFRDHFYVNNMHGYDWQALHAKYEPRLTDVADRSDLNYLLGQMIAELSSSHAYVAGGDLGLPERAHVGLLGARFALDAKAGRYRIAQILQGANDEERYRSPLTEVGVNVKEGDYVLAINGQPLDASDNPYRLLRMPAGQPVQLTVNSRPSLEGARQVLVKPIASEASLNYHAWVARNRDYVDKASQGRIGYLHIPDMGEDGIREFIQWYYPQLRKQGLVIDVRDNGGGNVSSMIIERLSRPLLGLDYARGDDIISTYPQQTFLGHLAALCNSTTASDGDIFSWMFKRAKLGPLIGTRTWGGVVGINDWGVLIDGGHVNVPQFGTASADGQWIIEGHGVEPDIVVENDVASTLAGRDPQLDRAIAELQQRISADPFVFPPRPADPVKAPASMRMQR